MARSESIPPPHPQASPTHPPSWETPAPCIHRSLCSLPVGDGRLVPPINRLNRGDVSGIIPAKETSHDGARRKDRY
jgi:hypothetical protein